MSTTESIRARRSVLLSRLLRWGFPLLSVFVALLGQVIIPRLLQLGLSEQAYTAYVAVLAVSAYIGMAEGGLFASVLRELSALHGAGRIEGFVAEMRRARLMFTIISVAGLCLAGVFLRSVLTATAASWPEASTASFEMASWCFLATTALGMGCGAYHTSVLYATGRLLAGQVVSLLHGTVPPITLIIALLLGRDLTDGLFVMSVAIGVLALGRLAHATVTFLRVGRGVKRVPPPTKLSKIVTAGLALRVAESLPQSAYPHVLTLLAATVVPIVVPARTFANACRLVSQQFVNLLNVHVTRRLAGDGSLRERGVGEYRLASDFLSSLQLLLLGMAAAGSELVFRLWLPNQADQIVRVLPGFLVEQALLSASLPVTVAFMAEGRLRTMGGIRIGGVVLGLLALVVGLKSHPYDAFGFALALAALPPFAMGAWLEVRGFSQLRFEPSVLAPRYGVALLVAGLVAFYRLAPYPVAAAVILVASVRLLPSSWRVWRALRSGQTATHAA